MRKIAIDEQRLAELLAEGKSYEEAAAILGGVSAKTLRKRKKALGLHQQRPRAAQAREHSEGYLTLREKGVHRLVMEQHLGRKLGPDEVVHHKDGNKKNNELSNLELMTREEHARHHTAEAKRDDVGRLKAGGA